MQIHELPFNQRLGLTTDGLCILLDPQPHHLNHVDTVHASVLFGVAEAAAGHFLMKRFPDLSGSCVAVLRGATTKYRRPAVIDLLLRGEGSMKEADADQFLDRLESRGRATADVVVVVSQGDTEIMTGTFGWFASRKS